MSISQTQAEAIKHMIENDPALCERLRGITEFDKLTSELAAAARAHGIEVDETALEPGLKLAIQNHLSPELSDEQLEGVTGGLVIPMGVLVLSAVAAAVIVGVVSAVTPIIHNALRQR